MLKVTPLMLESGITNDQAMSVICTGGINTELDFNPQIKTNCVLSKS